MKRRYSLTVFHTLPIDAVALYTYLDASVIKTQSAIWGASRDIYYPETATDPPKELGEGVVEMGWVLGELLTPASEKSWPKLKSLPDIGRFGLKLSLAPLN